MQVDGVRANRTQFNLSTKVLRRATAADLELGHGYPAGGAAAWRMGFVSAAPELRDWPMNRVEAVFTGRFATHGDDPAGNWPWNEARCPVAR